MLRDIWFEISWFITEFIPEFFYWAWRDMREHDVALTFLIVFVSSLLVTFSYQLFN